jgi:hypothetical protein
VPLFFTLLINLELKMRDPLKTLNLSITSNIPFFKRLVILAYRESLYLASFCKNIVICGFLRSRPLLRFTSKGASFLLGLLVSSLLVLLASFTLIPSICVVGVKYNLIEVARKVILL